MTTNDFIKEKINELKNKQEQLNKQKVDDLDLLTSFEIKLLEDEIYNYKQVLSDLEKLEDIESDIRWKMLNGEY